MSTGNDLYVRSEVLGLDGGDDGMNGYDVDVDTDLYRVFSGSANVCLVVK